MTGKAAPGAPTQPRPTDGQGHDLDEWGLPISGPARLRRLAELGKPDPNIDPAGWQGGARHAAPRKLRGRKGRVVIDEAAGFAVPLSANSETDSPNAAPVDMTENENG